MYHPGHGPKIGTLSPALLVVWLSATLALVQPAAAPGEQVAGEKEKLQERDRYLREANRLRNQGKLAEAIAAGEKVLALDQALVKTRRASVARTLDWLAGMHEEREDFPAAARARQQALALWTELHGAGDWRVTDARLALEHTQRLAGLTRAQRQQLEQSRQQALQAGRLQDEGKDAEAVKLAQAALQTRQKVLGDGHPLCASSLNQLAVLHRHRKDYPRAEALHLQALAIRRKVLGQGHPDCAQSLNNLGYVYQCQEDFARAEALHRQALAIREQALGPVHADVTLSLENLLATLELRADRQERREEFAAAARARQEVVQIRTRRHGPAHWRVTDARLALEYSQQFARLSREQRQQLDQAGLQLKQAEQLRQQVKYKEALKPCQQAVQTRLTLLGDKHPACAAGLNTLANLYADLGDYGRTRPLYEQALAIRKQVLGDKHPDYATSLNNLAWIHKALAEYARARPLYEQALAIRREVLGERHPAHANSLNNLANLYLDVGDYARALPLYQRALALAQGSRDRKKPDYAIHLNNLALLYTAMGDYARAKPLYEQALAIRLEVLGKKHPDYARSLNSLAGFYRDMGDYARAKPLYEQALAIRLEVLGEKHPAYSGSLNNLANVYLDMGDYARALPLYLKALDLTRDNLGKGHPEYALRLNNLAILYKTRGDYARARPLYEEALAIRKQVLGDKHPDYATSLNNLAGLHLTIGDHGRARALYEEALAIRKQVLGEKHPLYATSLRNLAWLYKDLGDYARALPLFEQAWAIRKAAFGVKHSACASSLNDLAMLYWRRGDFVRALSLARQALALSKDAPGEKHPDHATYLNNLAILYKELGDYARARSLYERALTIHKEALGEKHPSHAQTLNNLANLYVEMGDHARALPMLERALAIYRQLRWDKHPSYARSLSNLGKVYREMGEYAKARPLFEQVLALRKQVLGEKHPDHATSLSHLGLLYQAMRDYARARPLYEQALAIRKRALGEKHPEYATSLHNLGDLFRLLGEPDRAKPLYEQALAIRKQVLGDKHPDYARTLNNLALLHQTLGDYPQAEELAEQGLAISRHNLELAAASQSEREQLAMARSLRHHLDSWLSMPADARTAAERTYGHVLVWKGAVFVQQQQRHQFAHLARQSKDPEVVRLASQLQDTSRLLAALALAPEPNPAPEARAFRFAQLARLTEEKERLEAELSRRSAAFRRLQARQQVSPATLRQVLPAGVALVDFLEYDHATPPPEHKGAWQSQRRLTAFVVRPDRPVARLDLGPATPIGEAVRAWRGTLGRPRPLGGKDDPAAGLRRLVWQPLENHLAGAATVLVSPDGRLTYLPFAALPGSKPDAYLVEETSLAIFPVPALLPELLAGKPQPVPEKPSLLLVGDVDFDAPIGVAVADVRHRSAPRGSLRGWGKLKASREEVVAIRDSFSRRFRRASVTELREEEATTAAVRREAVRHRYLHLATHGFFAPPEVRSALAVLRPADRGAGAELFRAQGISGWHPGLLSGVVLAGANRPAGPEQSDGILTALEVSELDLGGVELAVLSACETGLGRAVSGEGVLSLQRAFQVAGARSTVASLWKVDDEASRALMVRFYEQLWDRKKPVGRLEAMRQAQLWLLREGVKRGMVRRDKDDIPRGSRTPPLYWAAFTLAGDWR
jgi:tetratricopeptide (TPR) repeat protein